MTLNELYKTIKNRQSTMPEGSYVASLFKQGEDRIIQKVGEEAIEVVIAAKNGLKNRTVEEIADLYFHLLVMMANLEITPTDIQDELSKRSK